MPGSFGQSQPVANPFAAPQLTNQQSAFGGQPAGQAAFSQSNSFPAFPAQNNAFGQYPSSQSHFVSSASSQSGFATSDVQNGGYNWANQSNQGAFNQQQVPQPMGMKQTAGAGYQAQPQQAGFAQWNQPAAPASNPFMVGHQFRIYAYLPHVDLLLYIIFPCGFPSDLQINVYSLIDSHLFSQIIISPYSVLLIFLLSIILAVCFPFRTWLPSLVYQPKVSPPTRSCSTHKIRYSETLIQPYMNRILPDKPDIITVK